MPFDWVTGAALNFSTNGVQIFDRLEKAAASLTESLSKLDAAIRAVAGGLDLMGEAATVNLGEVDALTASLKAQGTASSRAASAARRQAAAYEEAGAAARAAAAQTQLYARSSGGGGGRSGGGGSIIGAMPGPLGVAGRIGSVVNKLTGGSLGHMLEGGTAIDALYEAGHYQSVMTSIKSITGANDKQMAGVNSQMFSVGNMAGMSPTESAGMFREIARQSQGALGLPAMQTLMPLMAKAQTVIGTTRGYSPEQTTDAMMAYVHLMKMYQPKQMLGPQGFDLATKFFELIPNAPASAIKQLSYFVPQLSNLGVSDKDEDALMLTLARAGYGQGKGGTGLADLVMQSLGPLQVTSFAQAQKAGLLQQSGLTNAKGVSNFFNDKAGGNVIGMLDDMAKLRESMGALASTKLFEGIFGIQGARIGDLLANPVIHTQLQGAVKALSGQKSLGLNNQFDAFMGTFDKQSQRAAQNFQGTMTELGRLTLPAATLAAKGVADALYNMTTWLRNNPQLEHNIAQSLVDMAPWLKQTATNLSHVTGAIGAMAGSLGRLYSIINAMDDWIDKHTPKIFKPDPTYDPLKHGNKPAIKGSPLAGIQGFDAKFESWFAGLFKKHPDTKSGAPIINVTVTGPGLNGKNTTVTATVQQPRSAQATAGANRPHPHLPLALTVMGAQI
jgi:hypothetical protein